jgi:predicted neuraminidase
MSFSLSVIHEITTSPGLCHCSSIVETAAGTHMAVWYQGAYETSPDTAIMIARQERGADAWNTAEVLFQFPGVPLGNPVIFSFDGATFYVLFSLLFEEAWEDSVIYIAHSQDDGRSWSNPELLFPKKGLMGKTKPLRLASGRILVPLYDQAGFYPSLLVVEHEGRWVEGHYTAETMARRKAIQPAIVELAPDRLLLLCRTNQRRIWKSVSHNGGLSWSICKPTLLPNPNSAIDLLRTAEGELLLAFNNSEENRYSLGVALSTNDGESWQYRRDLDGGEGEYSYPCLIRDRDGNFRISYTEDRFRIKEARFDLSWLRERPLEEPIRTE